MEIHRLGRNDGPLLDAAIRAFRGFEERGDASFLADPRSVVFVARDGETVVGWASGHELPTATGGAMLLLYELEVAEAARGQGLGRSLVDAFVACARERGHERMWLLTDVEDDVARRLHEGAGGRPAGGLGYWWVFE
jgi:GNAT superfamily N-acetyltransferase